MPPARLRPRWSCGATSCEKPPLFPTFRILCYADDAEKVVNTPKLKDIEALCAAKGMRMTEQRRVIARVLAGSEDHPDVEELYRRCSAVDDRISISTVYRTVKLFEDSGIIERHEFRDGRARYEQIPDAHHDHLIDLRTGQVIEFQSEEIERLQAEVARKLGYKLVDHRLELYAVPLDDKPRR
jgi:Fur family ferric uptake transcriptional regulator